MKKVVVFVAIMIVQKCAYAAEGAGIRCKDLSMLQESGKNGFLNLHSGSSNPIEIPSRFTLPDASECFIENYGTSYPSYTCSWGKFQDADSAEAFKSMLDEQISGCIPKGAKRKPRSTKRGPNEHNSVYYHFGNFQPTISVDRATYHDLGRSVVSFKFEMDISENR